MSDLRTTRLEDALLSLYECFIDPQHFADLFAMIGAWLDEEPDAPHLVRLEAHSEQLWRRLRDLDGAAGARDRTGPPQARFVLLDDAHKAQLPGQDLRRLTHLAEGADCLVRLLEDDPDAPARLGLVQRLDGALRLMRLDETVIDRIRRLYVQSFDLTPAEMELTENLAAGETVASIARLRGRSPDTVRAQVKSLLSKLGVNRQSEVVRYYKDVEVAVAAAPERPAAKPEGRGLTLRDGRILRYSVYGPEGGRPLLYSHCLTDGRRWSDEAIALAVAHGFRVIAPSRAGFGGSDCAGKTMGDLLDSHAADYAELIAATTTPRDKITVLSYSTGLASAYRFALAAPGRVGALLAINPVQPLLGRAEAKSLRGMFRGAGLAAIYAPSTLRMMTAIVAQRYRDAGETPGALKFLPGVNLEEVETESGVAAFVANIRDAVADGANPYWREAQACAVDWADAAPGSNSRPRVVIFETEDSPLTNPGASAPFAERIGAHTRTLPRLFPFLTAQLPTALEHA